MSIPPTRRTLAFGTALVAVALSAARALAGTQSFTPSHDTFINSASANNNNGASPQFFTGRDGRGGVMRALVKFAMPLALQGKATVTSAQLTVTTHGLGNMGMTPPTAATLSLRSLIDVWAQGAGVGNAAMAFTVGVPCTAPGASWNHPDCVTSTWSALQAAVATASSPRAINTDVVFASTPAMVASVQTWIDGGTNQGFYITSSTETTTSQAQRFYATESGAHVPTLVVDYTTCTTAAQAACVASQAGNACSDPGGASTTFTCTCGNAAYTGTGTTSCTDRNDCATNHCVDSGDATATCTDHVAPSAGYDCTCTTGFTFNGTTCISLCGSGPDPCGNGGTCSVSGGGWSCSCPPGYVSSGGAQATCVNLNACNGAADTACVTSQAANACVDEPPPSTTYHCTCGNAAYVGTGTISCVDKNECVPDACNDGGDNGAVCTDHVAPATGYDCTCSSALWTLGMVGGATSCVDKNECMGSNPCGNGTCTNVTNGGGYTCACNAGFVSSGGTTPSCVAAPPDAGADSGGMDASTVDSGARDSGMDGVVADSGNDSAANDSGSDSAASDSGNDSGSIDSGDDASATNGAGDNGGCGCRTTTRTDAGGAASLALLAIALAFARRRR